MPQESRTPFLKGPKRNDFSERKYPLSLFTLPLSNLMMVRGSCVLFSKQCVGSRQKHLYGSEACASNDQIGRHWSAGGFVGMSIVDERKNRISSELNLKT